MTHLLCNQFTQSKNAKLECSALCLTFYLSHAGMMPRSLSDSSNSGYRVTSLPTTPRLAWSEQDKSTASDKTSDHRDLSSR